MRKILVATVGSSSLLCNQCGETWIEDGVAERLEQMVEDARVKNPVVEVANWGKVAVV